MRNIFTIGAKITVSSTKATLMKLKETNTFLSIGFHMDIVIELIVE